MFLYIGKISDPTKMEFNNFVNDYVRKNFTLN